jgi:hypothetical protein
MYNGWTALSELQRREYLRESDLQHRSTLDLSRSLNITHQPASVKSKINKNKYIQLHQRPSSRSMNRPGMSKLFCEVTVLFILEDASLKRSRMHKIYGKLLPIQTPNG